MKQRIRNALPLIAFALALLILGAASVFLVDRSLVGSAQPLIDERVASARMAASAASIWFGTYRKEAEAFARAIEPWTGSPGEAVGIRPRLDAELARRDLFDRGGLILSPSSLSVVAAPTSRAAEAGAPRSLPHLEQAARGKTIVSGLFEDPFDRVPQFGIGVPLRDGERVTGVLSVFTSPQKLIDLANQIQTGESAIYLIGPNAGEITVETPANLIQTVTADSREPAEEAMAAGEPGFHQYQGEAGVSKSAAYSPINGSDGWFLLVVEDTARFLPHTARPLSRLTAPGPTRTAALASAIMVLVVILTGSVTLRRLRSAQREADRAKRGFLAITGHELRTPLTSIRGFAQLLQTRWQRMNEEQRADMITTIARQARNLEHLVERLLAGAQIEAGYSPSPNVRSIDAVDPIRQAVEHHDSLNPLHEMEVDLQTPLMVRADTKVLEQVMNHILENAIKYSPDGGHVWVTGRRNGRWVEVIVEDEGIGLPSDTKAIFEKFAQAEEVDTRTYDEGGVGLGLFIARHYLSQMGGKIRAERRSPKGARLVIELRSSE